MYTYFSICLVNKLNNIHLNKWLPVCHTILSQLMNVTWPDLNIKVGLQLQKSEGSGAGLYHKPESVAPLL